jgi:hypothetical protein
MSTSHEKPILMSGEMVRAILAGRKTETRRVVTPQPQWVYPGNAQRGVVFSAINGRTFGVAGFGLAQEQWCVPACPYGVPGDTLWLRETHYRFGRWVRNGKTATGAQRWRFVAVGGTSCRFAVGDLQQMNIGKRSDRGMGIDHWWKRPSIFMPRWASRWTLRVGAVRVERLQDITEAGAIAEGVFPSRLYSDDMRATHKNSEYICAYRELWDKINAKRGYGWDKNPWVWVIEFAKVEARP